MSLLLVYGTWCSSWENTFSDRKHALRTTRHLYFLEMHRYHSKKARGNYLKQTRKTTTIMIQRA